MTSTGIVPSILSLRFLLYDNFENEWQSQKLTAEELEHEGEFA